MAHSDENKFDGIILVTDKAKEYLNPRQEVTYREHRRELAEWMLALGSNPEKADGYSYSTAETRMNRLDLFYRFIWDREGRYIQDLTTDHANQYMRHLARQNLKESHRAVLCSRWRTSGRFHGTVDTSRALARRHRASALLSNTMFRPSSAESSLLPG